MPKEKMVAIPGPTPVIDPIRQEMGREIQAFGDPRFVEDYRALIEGLGRLLACDGQAFPLAGTGSLAMEMAVANSCLPRDPVLVVSHGYFGDRFVEILEKKGRQVDLLAAPWGEAVHLDEIKSALDKKAYRALFVTHVDTSTGVRAPVKAIGQILQDHPDTLYVLDGVAATGGEYTHMKDMKIDILFTGSQKAFGVSPGMLVLWANQKALKRRQDLGPIPEYYVDYDKWLPIMEDPARYFATPAVHLVWAMKKSMEIMEEEGMEERAKRHDLYGRAMQKAFEAMGFRVLADPSCRATTLSCLIYPQGVKDVDFRAAVYREGVVIAGALGPYSGKACRVGHMGNIDRAYMEKVLTAMARALKVSGLDLEEDLALKVLDQALADN